MRLALPGSDRNIGTFGLTALLTSRSMFAAKSVTLGVFLAARVLANATLCPVLYADSTLNDT